MVQQPRNEVWRARGVLIACACALIVAGVVAWRLTPLADFITAERLARWLTQFRHEPWAPAVVVAFYVLAGFVVFPLLLLIGATAVVFEPTTAFTISLLGSLANAVVLYWAGASLARGTMQAALGGSLERVREALRHRGIMAVALVRSLPVAPFTVVNLVAGSIGVPMRDYLIGTTVGLAPGIVLMTAFGNRLRSLWQEPTPRNLAMLAAIVAMWIGTILVLQWLASRMRARAGQATSNS
jgi:phospholipase D1/2